MSKMEMMGSHIRQIFHALTMLQLKGLPEHFEDIKIVNVYESPGLVGDDWTTHLNDQGEAWIITPLHCSRGGSRNIRKTSRNFRWKARNSFQPKNHGDTSWNERKYKLVENAQKDTNKQTGLQDYTMIEYTSDEAKPKHALCRIRRDNKKYTQQPTNMEIDHADANKGETSLSLEPIEQGHVLTTRSYNQQVLEGKLRELIRQGFSEDDILEAFSQIKSEKIPAGTFEQWIEKDTLQGLVSSCSTHYRPWVETGGRMDWQVVEQNAQDPHNLSHNFNANSTELKESRYYHPSFNQNIIAPGPTPSYYAPTVPPITDQGTYNASEEQQFSLCNTYSWAG